MGAQSARDSLQRARGESIFIEMNATDCTGVYSDVLLLD